MLRQRGLTLRRGIEPWDLRRLVAVAELVLDVLRRRRVGGILAVIAVVAGSVRERRNAEDNGGREREGFDERHVISPVVGHRATKRASLSRALAKFKI